MGPDYEGMSMPCQAPQLEHPVIRPQQPGRYVPTGARPEERSGRRSGVRSLTTHRKYIQASATYPDAQFNDREDDINA